MIPVDFSVNTDIAIARAIEITQGQPSHFHLFHVLKITFKGLPQLFNSYISGYTRKQVNGGMHSAENRLEELKNGIIAVREDVTVCTWVVYGIPVQEAIVQKARRIAADLIVIGKHAHHSVFPFLNTVMPSRLVAQTGITVLTAKPGSRDEEIKTVVLPVGKMYPERKLEVLEALGRKYRLQVRLVSFLSDEEDPAYSRESYLNTFRWLKGQLANPVNCEVLPGRNKARALLNFCNKVGADVLIVYPESETRIGGWTNRHISDLLPAESRTQILAVYPS